jgi:protocatechuate 4,5-dioxygenase alpha chain
MAPRRDYHDIKGTYILDGDHSRKGYRLNKFCMSLNQAANREAFAADESAYIDRYAVTPEQKQAILDRDWLRLLQLGANIYYTIKIAAHDRISMQDVGAQMAGISVEQFRQELEDGGRSEVG